MAQSRECPALRYQESRNHAVLIFILQVGSSSQGQYKFTLVYPVCDKISITFDPFMYLSLPLASMATRSMTVTVFYGDGSSFPMPFTVNVSKHGYCKDLYQALGTTSCVGSDETLILAEAYDQQIYRHLDGEDSLH